jgi:acyl-CoA reductase-like NAD-dependent aldehyde dehydrogenase
LPRLVDASFGNAGQVCIKAQRVFVVRARFQEFLDRFVELTLAVGDPLDERTVGRTHDRSAPSTETKLLSRRDA